MPVQRNRKFGVARGAVGGKILTLTRSDLLREHFDNTTRAAIPNWCLDDQHSIETFSMASALISLIASLQSSTPLQILNMLEIESRRAMGRPGLRYSVVLWI